MSLSKFYLNIINHLQDGIYYVNNKRKISFWNHAAEEITGYTSDEMVGRYCQNSGLNHIDQEGRPLCTMCCPLYATLSDGKERQEQVFVRHKNGYRLPVQVRIFPVRENDAIVGAVEIFTRNSPTVFKDDLVDHLSSVAMHDALTKLPNRRYLESFLEYRMTEYRRFGSSFAVMYADIDNFSKINNTYGHEAGDIVLQNISATLQRSVSHSDMVGRWGGEEFLGICSFSSPEECVALAEKFRCLTGNTDAVCHGHIIHTTVSIGVTPVRPEDSTDSLIERADTLMYQSKNTGKNRVTSDISYNRR